MSTVGQPERVTQNRVVALFHDELGYRYLGDWTDRDGNSNIEEGLLSPWLTGCGYSAAQIGVALHKLRTEAANQNRTLYANNQAVYSLLRYGVPVKVWILENNPNARVAIITDRDELDKQIERVFTDAGEAVMRTSSGRDLMKQLGQAKPRLLCSLIHQFGPPGAKKTDEEFDQFVKELESAPSQTVGEVFVFVDECHRTQNGRLHRVMKALMPNAVFVGFTGTPLLKTDARTSLEMFGLLREDVCSARRDYRGKEGTCDRVRGVPPAYRRAREASRGRRG